MSMRFGWLALVPWVLVPGSSRGGPTESWTEPDRIEIPHLIYHWNHDSPADVERGMRGSVVVEIDNLVLRKLRYSTMWSFGGGTFKISGNDQTWQIGQHAVGNPLRLVSCKETASVTWSGTNTFSDRTTPGMIQVSLDPVGKTYALSFGLPAHLRTVPNNDGCIPPPQGQSYQPGEGDTILTVKVFGPAELTPPSGLKLNLEGHTPPGPISWSWSGVARVPGLIARLVPDKGNIHERDRSGKLQEKLVDRAGWIPEGATPAGTVENTFTVHLEIVDETGKPANPTVEKAVVQLEDTSKNPGVCSNWPRHDDPAYEIGPDLYFDGAKNKNATITNLDQTLELGGAHWHDPIVITSRDFGAYTTVSAKIVTNHGTLPALFDSTPKMSLPQDDDGNHMADAVIAFRGMKFDADDEGSPTMKTPGDGIKAFDEYRGFLISTTRHIIPETNVEEHRRLDPKRRQLFVAIESANRAAEPLLQRGVALFESASGIDVLYIARRDRFDTLDGDTQMLPRNPRKMAPNSVFGSDTAGVWVTTFFPPHPGASATAIGMAEAGGLDCGLGENLPKCLGSPRVIRYVGVDPTGDTQRFMREFIDPTKVLAGPNSEAARQKVIQLAAAARIDLAKLSAKANDKNAIARQIERIVTFSIAHELGHAVGATHHDEFTSETDPNTAQASGALSCPMRYWHMPADRNLPGYLTFFDESWDPSETSVDGSAYRFCTDNLNQMSLQP